MQANIIKSKYAKGVFFVNNQEWKVMRSEQRRLSSLADARSEEGT